MQLLLIRHGQPEFAAVPDGVADPALTELGRAQAGRLPEAVARFGVRSVYSSPQTRAVQTAEPVADSIGGTIHVLEGLAEFDYGHALYVPLEDAAASAPTYYARLQSGQLPEEVNLAAFRGRIDAAIATIVAQSQPEDTVAVAAHGGVINVILTSILGASRPLMFHVDYCSITRILVSGSGRRRIASVNETAHCWDLLPK